MCDYVKSKKLEVPRDTFNNWINSVQKYIKKNYKITFSHTPIGSGSRNMVIRKCNEDFFDLDFQIVMQSIPNNYNWNRDCKEFKDIFRTTFDKFKPKGFSFCEDSTQALTTKNINKGYGFDIIITTYDEDGNFYILYNKKNTNNSIFKTLFIKFSLIFAIISINFFYFYIHYLNIHIHISYIFFIIKIYILFKIDYFFRYILNNHLHSTIKF